METEKISAVVVEKTKIKSAYLKREVTVDFYLPKNVADPRQLHLLLINDGQDMEKMGFETIFEKFTKQASKNSPLLCVAIHCGTERKQEYGVANVPDYLGRGSKAGLYTSFVLKELLLYIYTTYCISGFKEMAFAGFSLGGLSALDIVWEHPQLFNTVGVFSGSLWWRSIDQDDKSYDDDKHRIMHQQIRNGLFKPDLKFFFQCGAMDEKKDRNNNGIIDSIEDTLDLIEELKTKGYSENAINYLELPDGKHDVPTWGKAMPAFLEWGWGNIEIEDNVRG